MKSLTILVTPINAVGHLNACMGALTAFPGRGHRVIFLIEEAWKGKFSKFCYDERLYSMPKPTEDKNLADGLSKGLLEMKIIGDFSVWEKFENFTPMFQSGRIYEEIKVYDGEIRKAIQEIKPDLIYFDSSFLYPSINYSGIPWILNLSSTPITLEFSDEIPPGCSGFPSNGPKDDWAEFNEMRRKLFFGSTYINLVEELGYPRYTVAQLPLGTQSLTVYAYPDELNYPYIRKQNWFNLEVFNKNPDSGSDLDSLIPVEFKQDSLGGRFSGKWIYISMGSMGASDVDLMKRIVRALGTTNHKCIVSKGPCHDKFFLPENMWGEQYLPQTSILPNVDLVITHGGNNSVTETFAQGKPMIVLPLFGDQFDNAQRLQETGFGTRLEPYKFTDEELVQTVDRLIYDEDLNKKLVNASNRILNSNKHEELVDRIEKLFI